MNDLLARYVINNWKLKLLSLVLAIMLWYTVFQIGEPKKDITVPVSLTNLPRDTVVMKMDPERVFVTVSGRVSMLKDIKEHDVRVAISLNGTKEGETVFTISKNNVTAPRGIEIVEIKPGTIRVVLDRIIEKRLKTVPMVGKKWQGRYEVTRVTPQHVIAEGPKKVLDNLATIDTMPVNGDLHRNEETAEVAFNMEDLPRVKVKPDRAKIDLRRHSGKETVWD